MTVEQQLHKALNKLAKWRSVFAGWQLGTRPADDSECLAVKDHRELTILMRVELNALTKLILDKKVFTTEEFSKELLDEAQYLDKSYESKFPGMKATDIGISYDQRAAETMKNWRP